MGSSFTPAAQDVYVSSPAAGAEERLRPLEDPACDTEALIDEAEERLSPPRIGISPEGVFSNNQLPVNGEIVL